MNKNTQTVLIATCLVGAVGGLLGVGLFIYFRHQQSQLPEQFEKEDAPDLSPGETPKKVDSTKIEKTTAVDKTVNKKVITTLANKAVVPKTEQTPGGDEFPLRLDSKGKRVERLRIWLMRNYGWTGIISDEFDKKTEQLLKRYLKKTQLDRATYHRLKMGQGFYGQS